MVQGIVQRSAELLRNEGASGLLHGAYRFGYYQGYQKLRYYLSGKTKHHELAGVRVEAPIEKHWQFTRFDDPIEDQILVDFASETQQDDVVYDIGAYLGWHLLVAASVAEDGTTIAFEPHPVTYQKLSEVSESATGYVETHQAALYDAAVEATLPPTNSSAAQVQEPHLSDGGIDITTVEGDQYVRDQGLPTPNIVKIDVEGAEANVLRGLSDTIQNSNCRVIYIETHPDKAPEGEQIYSEVTNLLKGAGFDWTILCTTGKVHIKGTRERDES